MEISINEFVHIWELPNAHPVKSTCLLISLFLSLSLSFLDVFSCSCYYLLAPLTNYFALLLSLSPLSLSLLSLSLSHSHSLSRTQHPFSWISVSSSTYHITSVMCSQFLIQWIGFFFFSGCCVMCQERLLLWVLCYVTGGATVVSVVLCDRSGYCGECCFCCFTCSTVTVVNFQSSSWGQRSYSIDKGSVSVDTRWAEKQSSSCMGQLQSTNCWTHSRKWS